jgi:hypothetical protein
MLPHMGDRLVIWSGADSWRAEAAEIELEEDAIRARGVQLGAEPMPYRLAYRLDATGPGFVTTSLQLEAAGDGWRRWLHLERGDQGEWSTEVGGDGEVDLPAAGGDPDAFAEALDCDLAFSPLTNTMPIRRHRLDEREETETFLMAWVSVPDLSVTPSRQHYTHVRLRPDGATVRYESENRDFVAELEIDRDRLVIDYPGLAKRIHAS